MSTRGSFILHKKGTDKELKIRHDAYPDGVGLDIVELIKTVDIKVLYDNIEDYEEASFDETIFDKQKYQAIATMQQIIHKLNAIKTELPRLSIISNRRADDILHSCGNLLKITDELENMVDLLR